MDVSSVQPTAAAITGAIKKSTAAVAESATTLTTTGDAYISKLAGIAAKYDPTHISLDQVPELGKDLYNSGMISSSAKAIMMGLPGIVKILARDGQSLGGLDIGTDGAVNLAKYWDSKASYQRTQEATNDVEQTASALETLASYQHNQVGANSTSAQIPLDIKGAISAYEVGIKNSSLDSQKVVDVLQALATSRKESSTS
jgi:hypothetical protein